MGQECIVRFFHSLHPNPKQCLSLRKSNTTVCEQAKAEEAADDIYHGILRPYDSPGRRHGGRWGITTMDINGGTLNRSTANQALQTLAHYLYSNPDIWTKDPIPSVFSITHDPNRYSDVTGFRLHSHSGDIYLELTHLPLPATPTTDSPSAYFTITRNMPIDEFDEENPINSYQDIDPSMVRTPGRHGRRGWWTESSASTILANLHKKISSLEAQFNAL